MISDNYFCRSTTITFAGRVRPDGVCEAFGPREGPMVTDAQVRLLRQKRMEGKTQETAAAAAGMSVRTARHWEHGALPSATKPPRSWRTRRDPFAEVWDSEIVPLLVAG